MAGAKRDLTARGCAVIGSPVSHSLSPVLHTAAYQELGLSAWRYVRREVGAGELAGFLTNVAAHGIDGLPVGGLSVTMPGKREALAIADERSDTAVAIGAANTLVPIRDSGSAIRWRAFNTDIDGIIGALGSIVSSTPISSVGYQHPVIVGSGGTAAAAVAALRRLGQTEMTIIGRDRGRAAATFAAADRLGIEAHWVSWDKCHQTLSAADLIISTVPAGVADSLIGLAWNPGLVLLDAVYAGGDTRLMGDAARSRARVVGGRAMLLHQAVEQVRLMTGQSPDVEVMRAALDAA